MSLEPEHCMSIACDGVFSRYQKTGQAWYCLYNKKASLKHYVASTSLWVMQRL